MTRDAISRCLCGVDFNPMLAELCRVRLWLDIHRPELIAKASLSQQNILDQDMEIGKLERQRPAARLR